MERAMANVKPFKPLIERFRDQKFLQDKATGMKLDLKTVGTEKTQVFVISPEIAVAAEEMVRSKSFKLPDISELRFPYEDMAIELPLTEEVRKIRASTEGSASVQGTHEVDWVAVHIHASKEGFINCTPYYGYMEGMLEPSMFSYILGMDDLPMPSAAVRTPSNPDNLVTFKVSPSRTLLEMAVRTGMPPEKMKDFYEAPQTNTMVSEGICEMPLLLFACSVLLNCKTGVNKTVVPPRKPPSGTKFGAKKRNFYSHGGYTLLHLSEIENVAPDGSISKQADIAAHYVRGHFKQRKSGVYWWSSFVRGTGEFRKRSAYIVKG